MKRGSSQNDTVEGEEKLSWMRSTVRSVLNV